MRSNLATRGALGAAVILFSLVLAAPAAHAAPPDSGHDRGNSSDTRRDHDGRERRDERRAAVAPAAQPEAAPLDEPQPASNADFSGNGANDHGAYDSTRDGSASDNGSGGGAAIGWPCAGCVGQADNKNPSGQLPDASDSNNGYECDGNSGIARTNPAHTGCVAPTRPLVPTGRTSGAEVLGVVFTAPAPAAVLSTGAVAPAAVASPAALAATGSRGSLPFAVFGGALVFVGAVLRRGAGGRVARG